MEDLGNTYQTRGAYFAFATNYKGAKLEKFNLLYFKNFIN
jgi:hypothetical protein